MQILVSILLRLAVVGMLVFASIIPGLGQEVSPQRSERNEAGREWSKLANGRTEFEVSDPDLLPSRLRLEAERSGCDYKSVIQNNPARFIKLERDRLAIVSCFSFSGTDQVFNLSTLEKPRVMEFPVPTHPEGFGTTVRPGLITWQKEAGILQAVTGSDMLPTWAVRKTYRFDRHQGGFVIIRVEVQRVPGPDEWTTLWDAPRWSLPEVKQ